MIAFAEALDVPIQVFHVSGAGSGRGDRACASAGLKVWAETCPQYLTLTADDLDRPGFEGAKYVFGPAPRAQSRAGGALGLHPRRRDRRDLVGPFADALRRPEGQEGLGRERAVQQGAERRSRRRGAAPLVFHEGVTKGRIDVSTIRRTGQHRAGQAVRPVSAQGHDRGRQRCRHRAVGSEQDRHAHQRAMHHGGDYTPYEGMQVTGYPVATYVRGTLVFDGETVVGAPGFGKHLAREPYPYIKPNGIFPTPFNPVDRARGLTHRGEPHAYDRSPPPLHRDRAPRADREPRHPARADQGDLRRRSGLARTGGGAVPGDREEARLQGAVRGHELADQPAEDPGQQGPSDHDGHHDGRSGPDPRRAREADREAPRRRHQPRRRIGGREAARRHVGELVPADVQRLAQHQGAAERPFLLRGRLGQEIQGEDRRHLDAHHAGDRAAGRRREPRDRQAARGVDAGMAGRLREAEGARSPISPGLRARPAVAAIARVRRGRSVSQPRFAHDPVPQRHRARRSSRPIRRKACSRCRPASRW